VERDARVIRVCIEICDPSKLHFVPSAAKGTPLLRMCNKVSTHCLPARLEVNPRRNLTPLFF
jgi:hypothetical protein